MTRDRAILAALFTATALAASPQAAMAFEAGDILVRLRGIAVVPDESGSTRPLNLDVDVSTSYAPELDATYFVTPNIAFELIAATVRHTVKAGGNNLGTTWVLPPTLTAQYHFFTDEYLIPYVGAGINYTVFYAEDSNSPFKQLNVNNSVGYALQAGIDFKIPDSSGFYLNADFKYIFMSPNAHVNLGSTKIRTNNFDLNPMIFGLGIGYKF